MYPSLTHFVQFLEERGELCRVREPVWAELEITEITDRTTKAGGPALLFENVIKTNGERSQFPLLINTYGTWKRMAWALGVEEIEEIAREIEEILKSQPPSGLWDKLKMLPKLAKFGSFLPKGVSQGVCQEVVLSGPDLSILPYLKCWPGDGGPYITFPLVITKDPDTGIRNVGTYRMQVFDKKTTGMHWQVHKTGARHAQRYRELKKKIPVAVCLGGDPAYGYSATAPLPDGVDELILAGFIRKKGVELVRCKTIDMEVPADCDFVIEGYVDPMEPLVKEGPFGDHTGYYSLADNYPLFHVTAITHRKEPIYSTTIVGPPIQEDGFLGKASERIFMPLIRMNFPEIRDLCVPIETCFHNLAIVSIKKQYPGHAKKIMHSIWGTGQMMFSKCIIVVDEDVNVQNLTEVAWRVSNNIDAKRDILFAEGPVDALDHAAPQFAYGSKMGIDATRKWREEGFERDWPEVLKMREDVKKRVNEIWENLEIIKRGK
ncbi:MAG: menaquinone biosynthesis decarboxylase [Deltaproteobacteria bacterium]|nr:menaquinone biosynthesis decarboxylase [Deltaproteobacteria bacterium]